MNILNIIVGAWTAHQVTQVKYPPPIYLHHSSFYNPSFASPTSQLILQPFRRFTYITAHSTTLPLLQLRHRHFTYVTAHSPVLSAALPTSQLILQPFRFFTYVTAHTLPLLHLRHRHFTYFTWRAAYAQGDEKAICGGLACYSKLLRSSYSFGQLSRILLRAVNLFSFSRIVSSDSSFNIHNALYFVKYPSRAAQNSTEGCRRPAGRGLKTLALNEGVYEILQIFSFVLSRFSQVFLFVSYSHSVVQIFQFLTTQHNFNFTKFKKNPELCQHALSLSVEFYLGGSNKKLRSEMMCMFTSDPVLQSIH